MDKRKFTNLCSECERPITGSAVIGYGRCCLIKLFKKFGCPNHGSGKLIIKKNWIGVKDCQQCPNEEMPGDENGINQIVWELEPTSYFKTERINKEI